MDIKNFFGGLEESKKSYPGNGYLLAILTVAAATIIFYFGRSHFAKGQWALLYLLVILAIASVSGIKPAIFSAFLAFLAWNYFLIPPYSTFRVHDPKDWLSLFVFLIVGVIVGLQYGKLKERETRALNREHETDLLNNFSAHLVSDIPLEELADFLAKQTLEVAHSKRVSVFLPDGNDRLKLASVQGESSGDDGEDEKLARWSHAHSKAIGLPDFGDAKRAQLPEWPISVSHKEAGSIKGSKGIFLPLQTTSRRLGALFVGEKADNKKFTFQEMRVLTAMAYQASAFLERKRLQEIEIASEARSQGDKLKSTIISSIHHELKTPLASINATVSNLLEKDIELNPSVIREELRAIEGDLNRLNSSIGSLVDLSRLATSDWEPKKDWYEFGEILSSVLSGLSEGERSRILLQEIGGELEIHVDFIQISRVLKIIIENALSYCDKGVKIGARVLKDEIRIWIEDNGPGIDKEDKQRIFDKFYRGKTAGSPGTGLGLAIALELVKYHGGSIAVEDVDPQGARFVITLPMKRGNCRE
jgi:two-component system sensor histidine kinase KdpD